MYMCLAMYFSWFLSVAGLRNIQGPPSDSKKDLDMQCTGDFHLYSGVDMSKSSLHRESTDSDTYLQMRSP